MVLHVDRTTIEVSGRADEEKLKGLFLQATNDTPLVSMRCTYDAESDKTCIKFIPGRIYSVSVDPIATARTGCTTSHERKFLVPGVLPKKLDLVESVWVPIRKKAKHSDGNLRWVVMYEPRYSRDDETNCIFTELTFIIESRDEHSHEPRGCEEKYVPETLDKAAEMVAERIREIVAGDAGDYLTVTHFLDQVTVRMSELLCQ